MEGAQSSILTGPWSRSIERIGRVQFFGKRRTLLWIMLRGYILTLLTLGVYRFWLLTQRRRFYWSNTVIDGHPLEYTGRSIQLLVGFVLAVLVFVPVYGGIFFLTTLYPDFAGLAYVGLFILFYFLAGYAMYRGRRFRLTRTLWRGIRFGQTGSAWGYAVRRFFWAILTIATLGLTYPAMVASLYRYRFSNTWFGDRQFTFGGRARDIAGPFFLVYGLIVLGGAALIYTSIAYPWPYDGEIFTPSAQAIVPLAGTVLVVLLAVPYLLARIRTRMLSAIRVGDAQLTVRIRFRHLLVQYLCYGALLVSVTFALLLAIGAGTMQAETGAFDVLVESVAMFGRGLGTIILIGLAYLAVVASYALLWEVILDFGYWKLAARDAVIANVDSLRTVRCQHDESPNIGEGFADALNVGAY